MATSRKKGIKAAAQDNFIVPNAPTIGTATDVGTARAFNNGAATVAFTPATTGNTAVVTGYTATSSPGSFTGTSATSPITVTGLQSNTAYTFTVVANSPYGSSAASSASASITATTVPQAPTIGTTTTNGDAPQGDTVNWTINATGGSAITGHTVVSQDGPTYAVGAAVITKLVAETAGTSQYYYVYSTNANGNSANSANSNSVTTPAAFSFTPFGFTPFGAFGFTPFGAFGFTPFGFTPFGEFSFTPAPFGAFSFTPFGAYGFSFSFWGDSIAIQTKVLTPTGPRFVEDLVVGDVLYAMDLGEDTTSTNWTEWTSSNIDLTNDLVVETTVTSVVRGTADSFIYINGILYTHGHYVLVKKDGVTQFLQTPYIDTTYEVYSYDEAAWVPITTVENVEVQMDKISINCEPYDNFFTEHMLVFDRPD